MPKTHQPLDIVCPGCRGIFHETTETFDPEAYAEPHMAVLKQKYQEYQWGTFSKHMSGYGCMECPSCGAMYAPSGRLETREQPQPVKPEKVKKKNAKRKK